MQHHTTPRSRKRPLALLFLLMGVWLFVPVTPVAAHPLGNFTVNRYSRVELEARQVVVQYVVDMAEIPAFQERQRIDGDGDGTVSPAEQTAYLATELGVLRTNLHLEINGRPLPLEAREHTLEFPKGQGDLLTMRLTAHFVTALPTGQTTWQARYRDDNYQGRIGWQEVVVRAGSGATLLESTVPAQDRSQELRNYPQDLLQSPPTVTSANFRWELGAAQAAPLAPANVTQANPSLVPDRLAALITTPTWTPLGLLLLLFAAFSFGAGHALSPGHGKTIVAAYLVGSRGTARHAMFLGLTTTITHTAGVFALGLVTLFVSQFILPEQLYPWLGVLSGLLVVGIGARLFSGRLRKFVTGRSSKPAMGHSHARDMHDHDHGDGQDHGHSHLPPGVSGGTVTWRSLLLLGISGGLLPCPSALVVLLSAIALHRVGLGLLLIVAFSLGLASVLTGIGIVLVYAGRLFSRVPQGGRLLQALPIASALVITLAGAGITWQALIQTGLFVL